MPAWRTIGLEYRGSTAMSRQKTDLPPDALAQFRDLEALLADGTNVTGAEKSSTGRTPGGQPYVGLRNTGCTEERRGAECGMAVTRETACQHTSMLYAQLPIKPVYRNTSTPALRHTVQSRAKANKTTPLAPILSAPPAASPVQGRMLPATETTPPNALSKRTATSGKIPKSPNVGVSVQYFRKALSTDAQMRRGVSYA